MSYIVHGVARRKGMAKMTGDPGSGDVEAWVCDGTKQPSQAGAWAIILTHGASSDGCMQQAFRTFQELVKKQCDGQTRCASICAPGPACLALGTKDRSSRGKLSH